MYLFIYQPTHLSSCYSCYSISYYVHPSICPPIYLSAGLYLSLNLTIYLSKISLSVSVCLSPLTTSFRQSLHRLDCCVRFLTPTDRCPRPDSPQWKTIVLAASSHLFCHLLQYTIFNRALQEHRDSPVGVEQI